MATERNFEQVFNLPLLRPTYLNSVFCLPRLPGMNNDSIAELYLAWKTGLSHAKSVVRGIGVFAIFARCTATGPKFLCGEQWIAV